jgi:hypothetical protein
LTKKIEEFQNQEELHFYVKRLSALMDFIYQNTIEGRVGKPELDIKVVSELIKQEEIRLQNISEED